jgi:hypothetical protein
MAQHGFGGGHAVEAYLAFGEMDVHDRISFQAFKGGSSRQLDQS